MYWTDWQKRRLERVNKNTGLERKIIRELADMMGLKAVNVKKITGKWNGTLKGESAV